MNAHNFLAPCYKWRKDMYNYRSFIFMRSIIHHRKLNFCILWQRCPAFVISCFHNFKAKLNLTDKSVKNVAKFTSVSCLMKWQCRKKSSLTRMFPWYQNDLEVVLCVACNKALKKGKWSMKSGIGETRVKLSKRKIREQLVHNTRPESQNLNTLPRHSKHNDTPSKRFGSRQLHPICWGLNAVTLSETNRLSKLHQSWSLWQSVNLYRQH